MAASKSETSLLFFQKDLVLRCKTGPYLIKEIIGEGGFGKVAECKHLHTNEHLAVKIVKKDASKIGKKEAETLSRIRKLDPDKHNLLTFYECFKYKGHVCLSFEMLDTNLDTWIYDKKYRAPFIYQIRFIARQLLVALSALKKWDIVHTDIKPDNIMLVDHRLQPFKVKLIDFGQAMKHAQLDRYDMLQIIGYRAPEVFVDFHRDESMDMWGLGCILAFLFLECDLFPTYCEYESLSAMVKLLGYPKANALDAGRKTKKYFKRTQDGPHLRWRLKTAAEYKADTGKHVSEYIKHDQLETLEEMEEYKEPEDPTDSAETEAFISLLRDMLKLDHRERITPDEALSRYFDENLPKDKKEPLRLRPVVKWQENSEGKVTVKPAVVVPGKRATFNIVSRRERQKSTHSRNQESDNPSDFGNEISNASVGTIIVSLPAYEETVAPDCKQTAPVGSKQDASDCPGDKTVSDKPVSETVNDATPVGNNRELPDISKSSDTSSSSEATLSGDQGSSLFVEVKTRKKYWKRIKIFFSRIFSCCSQS
ncbi:unnamed protein product [Menidia menidia]|uniref:(Atlantic silverside) hypothetical protein n=1 Tax=Menidia menidia TaxID=238744 RepID=A0A8S4BBT8_9TELE|nr:unnamed protein product [Menidia menidia]